MILLFLIFSEKNLIDPLRKKGSKPVVFAVGEHFTGNLTWGGGGGGGALSVSQQF